MGRQMDRQMDIQMDKEYEGGVPAINGGHEGSIPVDRQITSQLDRWIDEKQIDILEIDRISINGTINGHDMKDLFQILE